MTMDADLALSAAEVLLEAEGRLSLIELEVGLVRYLNPDNVQNLIAPWDGDLCTHLRTLAMLFQIEDMGSRQGLHVALSDSYLKQHAWNLEAAVRAAVGTAHTTRPQATTPTTSVPPPQATRAPRPPPPAVGDVDAVAAEVVRLLTAAGGTLLQSQVGERYLRSTGTKLGGTLGSILASRRDLFRADPAPGGAHLVSLVSLHPAGCPPSPGVGMTTHRGGATVRRCRDWSGVDGSCPRGVACRFGHPPGTAPVTPAHHVASVPTGAPVLRMSDDAAMRLAAAIATEHGTRGRPPTAVTDLSLVGSLARRAQVPLDGGCTSLLSAIRSRPDFFTLVFGGHTVWRVILVGGGGAGAAPLPPADASVPMPMPVSSWADDVSGVESWGAVVSASAPPRRTPRSRIPCRYHSAGQTCYSGDRCTFLHGAVGNVTAPAATGPAPPRRPLPVMGSMPHSNGNAGNAGGSGYRGATPPAPIAAAPAVRPYAFQPPPLPPLPPASSAAATTSEEVRRLMDLLRPE